MNKFNLYLARGGSTIAFALAALASPAAAQTAPTSPAAEAQDAEPDTAGTGQGEIIVTGSRLGRNSFNSPTPVNQITSERMENLALPSVSEALNQIPSFRASTTPTSNLFRVSGAIGANSVDLRGLGGTRTLTLLDGRRFVPSTDNGAVDLNGIPSTLVQRSEVVTGGASAAYGADAVAGVVNLILDVKMTGVKMNFSAGISEHGDNKNFSASVAVGRPFADGRGHFIIGAEYQRNYGIGGCQERAFCQRAVNYIPNPGYIGGVSTNGLPATLVLPDIYFVMNQSGVLASVVQTVGGVRTTLGQQVNNTGATALPTALRNLQFNTDGTALVPFQFGNLLSGTFMQGGDPSVRPNYGFNGAPLVAPTWHASGLAHVDYELTDDLTVSGELLFSRVHGGPVQASGLVQTPVGGSAGISINNPFITPAVRAQILAVNPNITAINVFAVKEEAGKQLTAVSRNDVFRAVMAVKGSLAADWNWDASYIHGETHSRVDVRNVRLKAVDGQAAAAITPPAGYTGTIYRTPAGAPVICSSSVANPSDGCIPINFLGVNSFTSDVLSKYFLTEFQTRTIKQDAIAVNVRGSLFDLGAGPAQVAVGAEWRRDTAIGTTDALTAANAFVTPQVNALPLVDRKVVEGYVEMSLPLLADKPLAKSLTIDGAARLTHYNTAGNATTWKLGGVYEPSDAIMFRVTRSHDIRAPTAAESNPNTVTLLSPLADPFGGGSHPVNIVSGGNPNLALETADTMTAGVVLRPGFIPRLRISADYYRIDVDGAIDALTAPNILTACFAQNLACNLIQFSGAAKASPVTTVFTNFQNLNRLEARGLEIVSDYRVPDVFGGNLDFQFNANYVFRLVSISATGVETKFDGVTGNAGALGNVLGVPRYKLDGVITYSRPSWSLTANVRFIPEAILDPTKVGPEQAGYNVNAANSVNVNTVDSRFYLNLSATVRPGIEGVEFYGSVSNVFDKYPPGQLRLFGNPLHYDVVGRAYRLGVRAKF